MQSSHHKSSKSTPGVLTYKELKPLQTKISLTKIDKTSKECCHYKLFYSTPTHATKLGYPQKFRAAQKEYSEFFENMLMHPKTVFEVFEIIKTIKKIQNFTKKNDFLIFQILHKITFLKHIFIEKSMLSVIRLAANGFLFKNAPIAPDEIFIS